MIRSISDSQDEILSSIESLYCPEGFECDLTYGHGGFWRKLDEPSLLFDIEPLSEKVVQADSTDIPLGDACLSNVVFDPPFLTYVRRGRQHKQGTVALTKRFGGYYTYSELENHYRGTLKEAWRVLKPKGILVFKCQDIIHNHRMHCTHHNIINWAAGFRLKDLFILTAKHRMPGPQKGQQRHARIWHSYFLVLQKQERRG